MTRNCIFFTLQELKGAFDQPVFQLATLISCKHRFATLADVWRVSDPVLVIPELFYSDTISDFIIRRLGFMFIAKGICAKRSHAPTCNAVLILACAKIFMVLTLMTIFLVLTTLICSVATAAVLYADSDVSQFQASSLTDSL